MKSLIRLPHSLALPALTLNRWHFGQTRRIFPPMPIVAMAVAMGMGWGLPAIAQSSSEALETPAKCEALLEAATLSGEGECVMENGDRYEGEFLEGQRTGKGRYEYAAGGFYIGGFLNGRFSGDGVFEAAQGHRYEGEFSNGQFNGQGAYRTADGNTYTGEFLNNTFHGEGTYTYADGRSLSGIWESGGYVRALPVAEEDSEGATTTQEEDPTEKEPTEEEPTEVEEDAGAETAADEEGEKEELDALAPQDASGSVEENGLGSQTRPDTLAPALSQ